MMPLSSLPLSASIREREVKHPPQSSRITKNGEVRHENAPLLSFFLSLDSRLVPYHHHAHACQINRPLLNLSELVLVVNVRKVAFF